MYWHVKFFIILLGYLVLSLPVMAQEGGKLNSMGENFDEVEGLYQEFDKQDLRKNKEQSPKKLKKDHLSKLIQNPSELSKLSHFKDIAVISKKYLPKLNRLEISTSVLLVANNAFFNNFGAGFRGAYYFSEKWGLEAQYYLFYSTERSVTEDLKIKSITTQSLVVSENFFGGSVKWVPVYGKISLFEKSIIPFDLFFNLGFGMTSTAEAGDVGTLQLGVGQQFAINKSLAVRWDIAWHSYSAQFQANGSQNTVNHSDLYISLGLSLFVPGAKYR